MHLALALTATLLSLTAVPPGGSPPTILPGEPTAAPATGASLVATELLVSAEKIEAGGSFRLAIVFRLHPGWHLYWKNPGASGAAPSVKLDLPPGFTAGELQWPLPKTVNEDTDIVNVYDGEFALVTTIQAPPNTTSLPDRVRLGASLSWLVCKDRCLAGKRDVSLEVPVRGAGRPVDPRVERFVERLPSDPKRFGISPSIDRKDGKPVLQLDIAHVDGEVIEFLPLTTPGVDYGPATVTLRNGGKGGATIRVPLTIEPQNSLGQPLRASGAVVFGKRNGATPPTFTEITFPVGDSVR